MIKISRDNVRFCIWRTLPNGYGWWMHSYDAEYL